MLAEPRITGSLFWLRAVSICIFAVYIVGFPLFVQREMRGERENAANVGWLYLRFKKRYALWAVFMELVWRKLLVVLLKVFLVRSPSLQAVLTIAVLGASLVAQLKWRPYVDSPTGESQLAWVDAAGTKTTLCCLPLQLDTLESLLLVQSILMLVLGLVGGGSPAAGYVIIASQMAVGLLTQQAMVLQIKEWIQTKCCGRSQVHAT